MENRFKTIDQDTLTQLGESICWDDSFLMSSEVYSGKKPWFPSHTKEGHNFHGVYSVCCGPKPYLEIVLQGCFAMSFGFFQTLVLKGAVKHDCVELLSYDGVLMHACESILYRFIELPEQALLPCIEGKSREEKATIDGYFLIELESGDGSTIIITDENEQVGLTTSDKLGNSTSIELSACDLKDLKTGLEWGGKFNS